MPKTAFQSVDDYIAAQPEAVQPALVRVRQSIRKAVPGAEEGISYQIPTYKLPSGVVLYFAAWKEHYSLYPATARLLAAFQNELAAGQVNKSTIRFPFSAPVPVQLIGRIARFRAQETAGRAAAKAATPKKRPVR